MIGAMIAVLSASGCAGAGPGKPAAVPIPTSPTSTVPVVPAPSATGAPQSGPCATTRLIVTIVGISGGAGHSGYLIRFQNDGPPCVLQGYPGLDGLDDENHVAVHAKRTSRGYLGGLAGGIAPNVELGATQTASALFEGYTGPVPGEACPHYTSLLVTPPDETHSVRLATDYTLCGLEVHPVVLGSTGGANAP